MKRRLRHHGLRKRDVLVDEDIIKEIIRRELQGPGSLLGYRGMHNKLRITYNISITRDKVMELLKDIDPEGTEKENRDD